jgi:hypothetical protein
MAGLPQLEISAAQAVIGLGVISTLQMYREAAPSLRELRAAEPNDYTMSQLILDADIYGGIAVVLIGGTATVLTRQLFPMLLAAAGLFMVSYYYRSVLASGSVTLPKETGNE